MTTSSLRNDWQTNEISALFDQPFNDLLWQAHECYRANFDTQQVQVSSLLNIKTGACPEDCAYCSQSARYNTGLKREKLMSLERVVQTAKKAKSQGASRFCMGAAWRNPTDKNLTQVIHMIKAVKRLGLETCATLGMLTPAQAERLKHAGLDYYNHNIDTSPEYYPQIISTRTFGDRLDTLDAVRNADIKVCCGAILGMGESRQDRISMLKSLANLPEHPQSVPINALMPVKGTPLYHAEPIDELEFVRVIAVARILMPKSVVRLSAGRLNMSDSMQALCFFAGANSIFYGKRLLTTDNPSTDTDQQLFATLGINQKNQLAIDN